MLKIKSQIGSTRLPSVFTGMSGNDRSAWVTREILFFLQVPDFNFADELSDLTGSGSEDTFDDLERGMENLES